MLVVHQVKATRKIEQRLFDSGVRGVLYENQSISLYPRALLGVISGELWFPRHFLGKVFLNKDMRRPAETLAWHKLTLRQKQIMRMLCTGNNNQLISESLRLSPHTVKSHIYNIYKKLKVGNRLQASTLVMEVGPAGNKK